MACRIGINGFGRIGRMVLRRSLEVPDVEHLAVEVVVTLRRLEGAVGGLVLGQNAHGFSSREI